MFLDYRFDFNSSDIFDKLLKISDKYDSFCFFDSNNYQQDKYSRFEKLVAIGSIEEISFKNSDQNINKIDDFINENKSNWKFLYLNYSLKNNFEKLSSNNTDSLNFNDIYIFIPKFIIIETKNITKLQYHHSIEKEEIDKFIESLKTESPLDNKIQNSKIKLKPRISKSEYLSSIDKIRNNIKLGDIYEMNFCQEFYCQTNNFDAIRTFEKLKSSSPAPFSAYFKENHRHLLSSSPERYIQKQGNKIISQPIKGTARRSPDINLDLEIKQNLENDQKERAENIMIVDLVRNDLSRISGNKNVKVSELCEIYSFPHVHQMISTVEAKIDADTSFMEIIRSSFPMGSMTGAPKIRAMELIEEYESHERGLFSGSVGYIDPKGDFDLNVIIRSLLYNEENNYLSLSTGGAITYKSKAESEYEESLLKAMAIRDLL